MREYCGYNDQSLRSVVIYTLKINELVLIEVEPKGQNVW